MWEAPHVQAQSASAKHPFAKGQQETLQQRLVKLGPHMPRCQSRQHRLLNLRPPMHKRLQSLKFKRLKSSLCVAIVGTSAMIASMCKVPRWKPPLFVSVLT